jgi:hypothetical protein
MLAWMVLKKRHARISIRQHTSAFVGIRQHTSLCYKRATCAHQHTSAYVSIRQHTSAYVSIRHARISIRQHT